MNSRTLIRIAAVLAISLLGRAQTAIPTAKPSATEQRILAPGVQYRHISSTTPSGEPWSIHVLVVNRKERSAHVRALAGLGPTLPAEMQRELPTEIATKEIAAGHHVVGVINGDYDAMPYLGVSLGPSVTSRQLWTAGGKSTWPALAVMRNGDVVIGEPHFSAKLRAGHRTLVITTFNKALASSPGLALYSREFRPSLASEKPFRAVTLKRISPALPLLVGSTVRAVVVDNVEVTEIPIPGDALVLIAPSGESPQANSLAQLRSGQSVKLKIHVRVAGKNDPDEVIGGFPIIVHKGRREILGHPSASHSKRHPRTAVCYNHSSVIFAVVDGRQPALSVGMTLDELGDLMALLGCEEAINTDGGGSSVMATADPTNGARLRIVNSPSDGKERGRGNAWIVESDEEATVH